LPLHVDLELIGTAELCDLDTNVGVERILFSTSFTIFAEDSSSSSGPETETAHNGSFSLDLSASWNVPRSSSTLPATRSWLAGMTTISSGEKPRQHTIWTRKVQRPPTADQKIAGHHHQSLEGSRAPPTRENTTFRRQRIEPGGNARTVTLERGEVTVSISSSASPEPGVPRAQFQSQVHTTL
jgi:hypothetical protein